MVWPLQNLSHKNTGTVSYSQLSTEQLFSAPVLKNIKKTFCSGNEKENGDYNFTAHAKIFICVKTSWYINSNFFPRKSKKNSRLKTNKWTRFRGKKLSLRATKEKEAAACVNVCVCVWEREREREIERERKDSILFWLSGFTKAMFGYNR